MRSEEARKPRPIAASGTHRSDRDEKYQTRDRTRKPARIEAKVLYMPRYGQFWRSRGNHDEIHS